VRRKLLIAAAVLIALLIAVGVGGLYFVKRMPLPKAQIASAVGKPAPDFTLTDQSGKIFELAQHRGHPVVLFFYRGHW
jgi:cytochrome oxidase Cu insertion factor (SCO1/SenC/PrrC family)